MSVRVSVTERAAILRDLHESGGDWQAVAIRHHRSECTIERIGREAGLTRPSRLGRRGRWDREGTGTDYRVLHEWERTGVLVRDPEGRIRDPYAGRSLFLLAEEEPMGMNAALMGRRR